MRILYTLTRETKTQSTVIIFTEHRDYLNVTQCTSTITDRNHSTLTSTQFASKDAMRDFALRAKSEGFRPVRISSKFEGRFLNLCRNAMYSHLTLGPCVVAG